MTVRISIDGYGRIGRQVVRLMVAKEQNITIVIIVDGKEENHDPFSHDVVLTFPTVAKRGPFRWARLPPDGGLTKWDVAMVVFQVLGILAAIIAVAVEVIK